MLLDEETAKSLLELLKKAKQTREENEVLRQAAKILVRRDSGYEATVRMVRGSDGIWVKARISVEFYK